MRGRGFTLVELIIVMGVMAMLFGIGMTGVGGIQGRYGLAQAVDVLVADLSTQQTKAMTGAVPVGGVGQAGYGVHFESNQYILFAGESYDPEEPSNAVVALPNGITVTNNTLGSEVVFERASGEIKDFVAGQDNLTLASEVGGDERLVRVNSLGVVVEGL